MISVTAPPSTEVRASGPTNRDSIFLVVAVAVSAALLLVGTKPHILQIIAGLFLLVVLPVVLVNAKITWPQGTRLPESLLYSLGLVLLAIMVGGLAINGLLPFAGVTRPLDRIPVIVTLLVSLLLLAAWRPGRWRLSDGLPAASRTQLFAAIGWRDQTLFVGGAILVVGSVAGAVRLNNGADTYVTIAMLIAAALVIVAIFSWRTRLQELTILTTIYLVSLSLLLMTSLRGWLVTGHDIQREFRVFELMMSHGLWDISLYQNAYNACMSVTILPTVIAHVTGISNIYIYKTVFQLFYALCPVLIYLIALRFASKLIAILAAVYFISFPTFFTDMPFLNRQEIAFVFLGIALLLITNQQCPIWYRRIGFGVFGTAIILSHYSTTYVLLIVLGLSWVFFQIRRFVRWWVRTRRVRQIGNGHARLGNSSRRPATGKEPAVVNLAVIVLLAVFTMLWVGPLTGTGNQVERTFSSTVDSLRNFGSGERSSDSSYSIFGGEKVSPQERMEQYQSDTIDSTDGIRQNGELYSLDEVRKYATPTVADEELPPTALGAAFERVGVDVSSVNRFIRQAVPIMLQLFIGLGLVLVLLGRARGFNPSPEFICGAAASLVAIVLHVLLPDVSVDYGIFRTFAQGLFWLAPFLALGSVQALSWLGPTLSTRVAVGAATFTFLSLTAVIPQILGGNQPLLHLNNAGRYYSNFYLHPQEMSAISWIGGRMAADTGGTSVQTEVASDRYAVNRLNTYTPVKTSDDIFPMLIRKDAYAFLGYTAVVEGEVSLLYAGDLVTYKFPVEFLDKNKSLMYVSGVSRVYR